MWRRVESFPRMLLLANIRQPYYRTLAGSGRHLWKLRYEIINDLRKLYEFTVHTGPSTISFDSYETILPIYASASA